MHPGMADAAQRGKVSRIVVRGVAVEMVNVKVPFTAADSAPLPVAIQDRTSDCFPSWKGILLLRPDVDREPFAVDSACGPHGERALVAESAEAVPVRTIVAKGVQGTVERVQAQLEIGAHGQKKVGSRTG
ncbi:MAG: hypothetical protein M0P21_02235 [Methanoculleus sp.]|jgi:hypothetical protein|nr:hypothetical protein [Methanoculleus sp.]